MRKIKWKTKNENNTKQNYDLKDKKGFISLQPMKIRVFELQYHYSTKSE